MATRQNSTEINIGNLNPKPLGKKAAEFVMVDGETQKGCLIFYGVEESAAKAIIAAAEIILRNSKQGPTNHA